MKALILVVAAGWVLAGCNTVHGIGKDLEKGGQAIEKAATK
ncbi:MAG: entericidin A/B family lipoprotein [Rhodocyclaceae bacterium]|nr:entericidin A/B family lipoprotein [Rhodocyclaceae bacterium]